MVPLFHLLPLPKFTLSTSHGPNIPTVSYLTSSLHLLPAPAPTLFSAKRTVFLKHKSDHVMALLNTFSMAPVANNFQFHHLCTESNTIGSRVSPACLCLQAQENTKRCHPSLTSSHDPLRRTSAFQPPFMNLQDLYFISFSIKLFQYLVPSPERNFLPCVCRVPQICFDSAIGNYYFTHLLPLLW